MTELRWATMERGHCPYCLGAGLVFFDSIADKRKQRKCPLCAGTGKLAGCIAVVSQGVMESPGFLSHNQRSLEAAGLVDYSSLDQADAATSKHHRDDADYPLCRSPSFG
jgi:hypothetical protein